MEKTQEVTINRIQHNFKGEPGILTYDEISNLAGINPATNPIITCLSPGRNAFSLTRPDDFGPRENGAVYHVADSPKNSRSCPNCERGTAFTHKHTTIYGMPETHEAGSERYECQVCGYAMFKEKGVKQGFKFVLD